MVWFSELGGFVHDNIDPAGVVRRSRGPQRAALLGRSSVDAASSTKAGFAAIAASAAAAPAALMEDNVSAHTARAEAEIACGRAYAVIGKLEELVAQYPYHEPLWAQLITAYYVAERQSDALEAYRRLKTVLAEDLGIDPGPTVGGLHVRILRQERLDTKLAARTTAARTLTTTHSAFIRQSAAAGLRDAAGRHYPLQARPPG